MSPAPAESSRLRILGDALAGLRDCARTGAEEVLGLYPDVGDREVQSAVEACLEDVAEILRLLDEDATSLTDDLHVLAGARPEGARR
jgi:hypothetical protein